MLWQQALLGLATATSHTRNNDAASKEIGTNRQLPHARCEGRCTTRLAMPLRIFCMTFLCLVQMPMT